MSDEKGWAPVSNSRKWHYFEKSLSLCGRWLRTSWQPLQDDNHDSPDNCKACRTKMAARAAKAVRA